MEVSCKDNEGIDELWKNIEEMTELREQSERESIRIEGVLLSGIRESRRPRTRCC